MVTALVQSSSRALVVESAWRVLPLPGSTLFSLHDFSMAKDTGSDTGCKFLLKSESLDSSVDGKDHVDPSYKPKLLKYSGTSIESTEWEQNQAKILVLYTGGTIGMRSNNGVYSPEANYLVPKLRNWLMFHDPTYNMPPDINPYSSPLVMPGAFSALEETPVEGSGVGHVTRHMVFFSLPLSKEGRRIIYCLYEYEPLLDSANMTVDDYARLAKDIKEEYFNFDGFVVLHGTDTMSYTASALSFMLENLGKPVILTGSQIPIFETRSDGRDNFLGALIMAGNYCIPEVTVYFHNMLLRGNRSTKYDTGALDAFRSVNLPPLAELEVNIKINWEAIWQPRGVHRFHVHTNLNPNVGLLRLFPSITTKTVQAFLQPPMEGVVIQSYGAGNGPDARQDLLALFKEASNKGIIIVNITQCSRGMVSTSYATGKALVDAGVIPGSDLTPEAALMKLGYVLSKDWDLEKKRKIMNVNLRGEMTVAISRDISLLDLSLVEKMAEAMRLSSKEEVQSLRDAMFPSLLCAAAKEGNIEALEKLRVAGAVFSMTNYDGRTALHVASCEGHFAVVEYLLEYGASVHVRDRYGHSPLDDALRFNRASVITLLVDTGAHLSLPPAKLGMMLCNSAVHEDVRQLESWRLAGADLNQADYTCRTALHVAAARGNMEVIRYLLEKEVKVDVKDTSGLTPIDEARMNHHDAAVELMTSYLSKNDSGSTKT